MQTCDTTVTFDAPGRTRLRPVSPPQPRTAFCVLLSAFVLVGCTALEPGSDTFDGGPRPDAGLDAGPNADGGPDAGVDAGPLPCPEVGAREELVLGDGEVTVLEGDTRWTCQQNVRLAGTVFVVGGTLFVDPDVHVFGDEGGVLIVSAGARIEAVGTAELPIVFTSSQPVGERSRQDWRGLILIGRGVHNLGPGATIEETPTDARAEIGGGTSGSETHDCGTLRFVRVEFAGGDVDSESRPAAGLTLAACGTDTVVDTVQVHRSSDGLGFYGGTVDVRRVVVTSSRDDGIEWVGGFRGTLQFVVVQGRAANAAGIHGSNSESSPEQEPRSAPRIHNATVVVDRSVGLTTDDETGLRFNHGTAGEVRNSILQGWAAGVDVVDSSAGDQAEMGNLVVSHSIFFENASALAEPEPDDDGGFDEEETFSAPALINRVGTNPRLERPGDPSDPVFSTESNSIEGETFTDAGFEVVGYVGAIARQRTGAEPDWTLGWTAYLQD